MAAPPNLLTSVCRPRKFMLMENVGGLLSEAMKDITDCASAVWTGMPLVPLSGTQISLSLSGMSCGEWIVLTVNFLVQV